MNFKELLTMLHSTEPQPNPNYYKILVDNSKLIVLEVAMNNQTDVARQLGMSQSKLSAYLPLFKAYAKNVG